MSTIYVIDFTIVADGALVGGLVVADNPEQAKEFYAKAIDQNVGAETYLVRLHSMNRPAALDTENAEDYMGNALITDYRGEEGVIQSAVFARFMNRTVVDMSIISAPHLAGM